MKINILIAILSLLLISGGCSEIHQRDSLHIIVDFPETRSLQGSPIPEIRKDFYSMQMGIADSMLIFCDWESSPHFHVYQLPSFTYGGSFGIGGKGPNELLDPLFWSQVEKGNAKGVWVYQMNKRNICLIDVEAALNDSGYQIIKEIGLPVETDMCVNVLALHDDIFVGSGISDRGEFFIYDAAKDDLQWKEFCVDYGTKVNSFINKNPEMISHIKQGIMKMKPDQSLFVKSFVYLPIIDIYDAKSNLMRTIMLGDYAVPEIRNNEFESSSWAYYENIFLTDQYIYALYRNCNLGEYREGLGYNTEVHVYNWEAHPVIRYKLNEGIAPAAPFVVDEKNERIYTLNPMVEEEFYKYFETGNL